jgi:hypothetical protein
MFSKGEIMPLHSQVAKGDGTRHTDWQQYYCAHCNSQVSGAVIGEYSHSDTKWLFCPNCLKGSTLVGVGIFPSPKYGPPIEGLPTEVASAYDEVRRCMSVNAHVASELICRKILMHVSVDKGAKPGETFASYLDYLANQGYITPPIKVWADKIRQHGNEATHEINEITRQRAEGTVMFTAELLRLIYEMDHLRKKFDASSTP